MAPMRCGDTTVEQASLSQDEGAGADAGKLVCVGGRMADKGGFRGNARWLAARAT